MSDHEEQKPGGQDHDHDHGGHHHDHGHGPDHDHNHDHDHGHDQAHPATHTPADLAHLSSPTAKPPPSEPAAAEIMPGEDIGSQALAHALASSFTIVKIIMGLLIVVFFVSGIFTVPPQEKAVVFRFGKPLGTGPEQLLGPGLHWSFPRPIDEIVKIPIGEIQTVRSSAGWYATSPEYEAAGRDPDPRDRLNPAVEGYTLTGDGNIIHVRATVRYRIVDPLAYAFQFVAASNIVQNALDNALFYGSAHFTVDRALRKDVIGLKEKIVNRVTELINGQQLGIQLDPVDIQVSPPLWVKAAFNEVLSAEQERSTAINKAQGNANVILSGAEGEARAIVNGGEADRAKLIQTVGSEARYLQDRLPEYRKNRRLFEERLLTEVMQRVLTNAQDKFFLPNRVDGGARELRLLLNREPQKPSVTQTNQP